MAPRYASIEKRYCRLIEIAASAAAAAIVAVAIVNAAIAAAGVQKRFGAETHAAVLRGNGALFGTQIRAVIAGERIRRSGISGRALL